MEISTNEEKKKEEKKEAESPPSSPPTPPSPLPISVGPSGEKYRFSSSPSPSPPFSPRKSDRSSGAEEEGKENEKELTLFHYGTALEIRPTEEFRAAAAFSLDRPSAGGGRRPADHESSNCLKDLIDWFVLTCCSCCSWNFNPPTPILSKPHQS